MMVIAKRPVRRKQLPNGEQDGMIPWRSRWELPPALLILNHNLFENLFEIPEPETHRTEVQKTIFKGELVYHGNLTEF